MAERVTNSIINVEQQLEQKMRVTNSILNVEEQYQQKMRVTNSVIMVEYVSIGYLDTGIPVQMI